MTVRLALLLGLLPGLAAAQDAAPVASPVTCELVISHVQGPTGARSRRIERGFWREATLVGEGFPPGPPGLEIELDGVPVQILDQSPTYVRFLVPEDGVALGPTKLRVRRPDGARAEAELQLVEIGHGPCLRNGLVLTGLRANGVRSFQTCPGDTLEIAGTGWPSDGPCGSHPAGLSVDLSGCGLLLLEATPGLLVVQVRDAVAIGPSTLRIRVDGVGDVETPLEVVEEQPSKPIPRPPRAPARQPPAPGPKLPPVVQPDPAEVVLAGLRVDSCGFFQDGAGQSFHAKGTVPGVLPDGFRLTLSLERDRRTVETRQVEIRAGAWQSSFGPFPGGAAPGRYTLSILFELAKQPRALARAFHRRLGPEVCARFERVMRLEDVGSVAEPGRRE